MGMKSKVAMAVLSSAAGAAMIAGGTFALFTAQTSNTGNTFTAGTVAIQDYTGGPVASHTVYFNSLAPGDSGTLVMTVKNTGSLKAWVKIDSDLTIHSESGALFTGDYPLYMNLQSQSPVTVDPGQTVQLRVPWSFPVEAGNYYQGTHGWFNLVVDAVQYRNNTAANFINTGSQSGDQGGGTVSTPVATTIQVSGDHTIANPGDEQSTSAQYTATVYDQNNNVMSGQQVTWSLTGAPSDGSITINPSTGLLTVEHQKGSNFPHRNAPYIVTVVATITTVHGDQPVRIVRAEEVSVEPNA
ncbi:TasA family protein [Alicyclobacillus mengziensis]|uniref:Camelysin metallo-endopeptidase n=1 Tax=Alicyclobacillus mengziensis TaxID=2931921 RepID=A0A9X7VZ87_9BACL|nr:TasA family protein [Alicyclobacillus mengziensis]QSO47295.1 hypothetical protein JZ786_23385 [Alicyclobacillus mengziensis]